MIQLNARFKTTCALLCLVLAGAASAQERSITVSAPGGTFEEWLRKDVFPAYTAKTGVKVNYVVASATDLLAKLQAQKGNQQIDVGMFDDGPMYQANEMGFCAPLAKAPIYDDVMDSMKLKSGKGVFFGVVATGITYNQKYFDEHKWPAPTSWNDIADPKYRNKLVIFPLNSTYGVHALVMAARQRGGSEKNIEPGFKAFRDEIGPNVLAYEPSPAKVTELFQSGQAVIAVYGNGRTKSLADTGFPVDFVYPKEGGVALAFGACPVAGAKNVKDAQSFIQFLLTPDVQRSLAKGVGFSPVNKKVTLTAGEAKGVAVGPQLAALKILDWETINKNRAEWNKRWTHEIER
jgi:putative spermidine/putrescine transport system substrate-binding protein